MNKIVISKILFCTTLALSSLASCGSGKEPEPQKTPEEIRLEEINRVDSVELMMHVNPDTIEGRTKLDSLSADAWMLIDDSTGIVLSAKNAYSKRYMASITKIMTCLLALEKGVMTDTIEITQDDKTVSVPVSGIAENYAIHYVYLSADTYKALFEVDSQTMASSPNAIRQIA